MEYEYMEHVLFGGKLKVKYMYESRHMNSKSRHAKLRTLNLQMISKLWSKQLVLMH